MFGCDCSASAKAGILRHLFPFRTTDQATATFIPGKDAALEATIETMQGSAIPPTLLAAYDKRFAAA